MAFAAPVSHRRHGRPSAGLPWLLGDEAPGGGMVHVLAELPDLLDGVSAGEARVARAAGVARRAWLAPGAWDAAASFPSVDGWLGLLVLDGMLTRGVRLAGARGQEIVGPGDVLRPWDDESFSASSRAETEWRALVPVTLALLDGRFAAAVRRWPSVAAGLLSRAVRRSCSLAALVAITQIRRADLRLLVLLWQLADRWGRVTPEGVVVPVPLSQERLGQLVGLRRPTVSMALGRLRDQGEIVRRADATWLLTGDPPQWPGGG